MSNVVVKRINPFAFRTELNKLQKKSFSKETALVPIDEGWWWAAFDEEKLVAYACMKPSGLWRNTTYLSRAGVEKAYRGRGLQKKLIAVRVNFAKKSGYDFATTDTYYNPESANNIIAAGFKTFLPKQRPQYEAMILWFKDLKNKTSLRNLPKAF